jgi:hypothetical protein
VWHWPPRTLKSLLIDHCGCSALSSLSSSNASHTVYIHKVTAAVHPIYAKQPADVIMVGCAPCLGVPQGAQIVSLCFLPKAGAGIDDLVLDQQWHRTTLGFISLCRFSWEVPPSVRPRYKQWHGSMGFDWWCVPNQLSVRARIFVMWDGVVSHPSAARAAQPQWALTKLAPRARVEQQAMSEAFTTSNLKEVYKL